MDILGFSGPATPPVIQPDRYSWLEGTRIYHKRGKVVVKCNATDGVVARKVDLAGENLKTEAFMGKYAREVAGMKVPAFQSLKFHEEHPILTTEFDPGQPLDSVWYKLTYKNRASIKEELKQQIQLMRQCKMNRLGCVNQLGEIDPKIPVPDPYNPCVLSSSKPCASEAEFDANKIEMVKRRGPAQYALLVNKLQHIIQELSADYTDQFVLTHGDLSPCNILVQDVNKNDPKKPYYSISSIIDWQFSGFFPQYMEYAIEKTRPGDIRWSNFMCGLLEEMNLGCSKTRIEAEQIFRNRLN